MTYEFTFYIFKNRLSVMAERSLVNEFLPPPPPPTYLRNSYDVGHKLIGYKTQTKALRFLFTFCARRYFFFTFPVFQTRLKRRCEKWLIETTVKLVRFSVRLSVSMKKREKHLTFLCKIQYFGLALTSVEIFRFNFMGDKTSTSSEELCMSVMITSHGFWSS